MGIYLKKTLKNGATIGVWQIVESEEEMLNLLGAEARDEMEDDLEEINLNKSQKLRTQQLAVRLLINDLFGQTMHVGHHENGSPYLENDGTHISISHTDNFAAVILHPTEEVGIDIESIKRNFNAVEKRALSEEERDDLIEADAEDAEEVEERNTQLAIYWCAKEAIYKRMDRFQVDFSEDIELEKFNVHDEGEIEAVFKYPENEQVVDDGEELPNEEEFNLEYEVFEDHVMVWLVG